MRIIQYFLCCFLVVSASGQARADYAEDHPEWFNLTAPPSGSVHLAADFLPATHFFLRPDDLELHLELLPLLTSVSVTIVHGGEEDLVGISEFLNQGSLTIDDYSTWDVEDLNTNRMGEFFPLQLEANGSLMLVDPRFPSVRPFDDAVGSKLAGYLGTCAYRPPFFANAGYLSSNGTGTCVVSGAMYGKVPALTEAEVNGQLSAYLGCSHIIRLQALNKDGIGRLDTFFRFATPTTALLGLYNNEQDSTNTIILGKHLETLTNELDPGMAIITIPMPAPLTLGNSTLRPSYLHYLRTNERLILPVFSDNLAAEAQAKYALKQVWPGIEVKTINATELAYSSASLTDLVGVLFNLAPPDNCEPPETICETSDPNLCALCWDECFKLGLTCASFNQWSKCEMANDGCFDATTKLCKDDEICEANGQCEAPPGPCDEMPPGGTCDNGKIAKCVQDTLIHIDCEENGKLCTIDEDGIAICFVPCSDDCEVGTTFCKDDDVYKCDPNPEAEQPCGQSVFVEDCPAGTVCTDGTCVEPASENEPDTVTQPPDLSTTDTSDWNAGFKGGNNKGCTTTSIPCRAVPGLVLLLLLFLTRMKFWSLRP
jgi:hypothetical protein